jgi:hypothetical protein
MSQHYSDQTRENEPTALPDVETFQAHHAECPECGGLVMSPDCTTGACQDDGRIVRLTSTGWFYWFCFPGCLPDSEPKGPFQSEDDALDDAREN